MSEGTGGAVAAALSAAAAAVEEAEIDAMAVKMRHQHQVFMQQQQQSSRSSLPSGSVTLARPGQPAIAQYFGGGTAADKTPSVAVDGTDSSKAPPALDEESRRGRFGWFSVQQAGQPPYIPYLLRYKTEPYASVRIVERMLLNRYLQLLPPEVNSCTSIHSYYITEAETKLLNDINRSHSDGGFGKEAFTCRDLVVAQKEVEQFQAFLDLCHRKLVLKKSHSSDRCGFYRINGESVVPYTVRGEARFIPLFYFEGETDKVQLNSCLAEGWDLSYLKFCFKVQGIRGDLYQGESCKVVSLEDIQAHFPPDTTFEDYWPAQGSIGPANTTRQSTSAGNWTQKPAGGQLPSLANLNLGIRQQQQQQQASHQSTSQVQQAQQETYKQLQQQLQQKAGQGGLNQQQQQFLRMVQGSAGGAAAGYRMPSASDLTLMGQAVQQVQTQAGSSGRFSGKLTKIKEFPLEAGPKELPPYMVQKALIDNQMVSCINVRPFMFNGDLMMTLGDLVGGLFPQQSIERILQILESLKVVLYEGNKGHQAVLRRNGKYKLLDPAPLVLIKSVMDLMPQMKFLSDSQPSEKRQRME